jgi:hypothetical protein
LLGLDRAADFGRAEREDPDLLIAINSPGQEDIPSWGAETRWSGQANLLDPHPMYRWPVIGEVADATNSSLHATDNHIAPGNLPPFIPQSSETAARIILNRRSAQRFDSRHVMAADVFHRLLDSVLPRPSMPWDIWGHPPRLHPVLFVHRVADIAPGLYILPRHAAAEPALRESLKPDFTWRRPEGPPATSLSINCSPRIAAWPRAS